MVCGITEGVLFTEILGQYFFLFASIVDQITIECIRNAIAFMNAFNAFLSSNYS